MTEALQFQLWGNSVESYITFLLSLLGFLIVITLGKKVIIGKLKRFSEKTKNKLDDFAVKLIDEVNIFFFFLIAFYFALETLNLPPVVDQNVYYIFFIFVTVLVIRFLQKLVSFLAKQYSERIVQQNKTPLDKTLIKYLVRIASAFLWIFGLLMVISNLGYNVSSLLAGVGIGGIAVALASQQVLTNFLSSLFIIIDKPFKVGDTISIGENIGEVLDIGFRSTRLKTLRGEELIVSNSDVMASRIQNYKKMKRRRVQFNIGVTYNTPLKKLKKIPDIIGKILLKQKTVDHEEGSYRVHFAEYADFSLVFEIVYHLDAKEFRIYRDTQQDINFAIAAAFEKEKIEMAFPTQTIYLKK